MKISFFKNGYIALNEDHSYTPPETIDGVTTEAKGHQDCLFCENVDFDPNTQTISFDIETKKYTVSQIPKSEYQIIFDKVIGGEKVEEKIDPAMIGEIIITKDFLGNINAQLAALSKSNIKILAILANIVGKPTINAVFAEEIALARSISETRVLCGLSPFDLSFLD